MPLYTGAYWGHRKGCRKESIPNQQTLVKTKQKAKPALPGAIRAKRLRKVLAKTKTKKQ